jgi:3-phenylpropionate/cinnamic acid dioxygenase small subunit
MLTPREQSDHTEIAQLLYRYGRAIDTRDFDELRELFTPDAEICYAVERGSAQRLPEMVEWLRRALTQFKATQHAMASPIVELDGDRAHARTSLVAAHVQERLDGTHVYTVLHGTYRDELVRTPRGWRIAARRLDPVWTAGEFATPDAVKHFEKPAA